MASTPTALPPPPGADQGSPPEASPTSPAGVSPSPARPSPVMDSSARALIGVVGVLRGIAKAYPEAAPTVAKINDLIPELQAAIMKSQAPGEPAAPPMGA